MREGRHRKTTVQDVQVKSVILHDGNSSVQALPFGFVLNVLARAIGTVVEDQLVNVTHALFSMSISSFPQAQSRDLVQQGLYVPKLFEEY
jgi:hypothetical protein